MTPAGDTQALDMCEGFQLLATMTPPSRRGRMDVSIIGSELSPALANRFSIVVMDDPLDADDAAFKDEVRRLCAVLLDGANVNLAADVCCIVRNGVRGMASPALVTYRNFVRLLDSAYQVQAHSGRGFTDSLWAAFQTTFRHQLAAVEGSRPVLDEVAACFRAANSSAPPMEIDFLAGVGVGSEHVLTTASRQQHASAVIAAIRCSVPVLLEGPAAVGKTSLIQALCQAWPGGQRLERVNNSESTSVQDYFGMYLPSGKGGFVFKAGALETAMRDGCWFLADELNLAQPAVLSMLNPLLEGQRSIQVPGTDRFLTAKTGFRFFATQNSARYANRNALPVSIRNRFLDVSIHDFPKDELGSIIEGRQRATSTG